MDILEIPWAPPSGFPSRSFYISPYIPTLVIIQIQSISNWTFWCFFAYWLWYTGIPDCGNQVGADGMENLRGANTELSMHFRETNKDPSMHFRKADMDPSMHFRKAIRNYCSQFYSQLYSQFHCQLYSRFYCLF